VEAGREVIAIVTIEYEDGTSARWETSVEHAQVIEKLIMAVIGKPDLIRV
jgi:hypothetical protein